MVFQVLKDKLESWQEVEINIAIIGDSGTGKSSFVNSIRGLPDSDVNAAKVDVIECTSEPAAYNLQNCRKTKFWDLPGLGTPKYPDLETYCKKVKLEKFHAFLLFTANRFTENDLKLAQKVRSIGKKFFFVRTKTDENVQAELRKKSFNENAMLKKIRRNCLQNLGDLLRNEQDIFLISNHYSAKWDFARLTAAILDVLPTHQRESLTLSLGILTSLSTIILKRKVEVLKGRIWMVAAASAAAALVPVPGVSFAFDAALILKELSLYRSQLGLPEEGSNEFASLPFSTQENIHKVCQTRTVAQLGGFLAAYTAEAALEEVTRFIPFVGLALASGMSFVTTSVALKKLLKDEEEAALLVLKEARERAIKKLY